MGGLGVGGHDELCRPAFLCRVRSLAPAGHASPVAAADPSLASLDQHPPPPHRFPRRLRNAAHRP
eukprot:6231512-Prymnesium_polylepis.1